MNPIRIWTRRASNSCPRLLQAHVEGGGAGVGGRTSRPWRSAAMCASWSSIDDVGAWEVFMLIVRRELCLSFRRPEQLLQPLVFFLIVTTLFPLGLSLQLSLLRDISPGVLWMAALLSSLLSLDSLFKSDADDGTLEQLSLSRAESHSHRGGQNLRSLAGQRSGPGGGFADCGDRARYSGGRFCDNDVESGPRHPDFELARGHRRRASRSDCAAATCCSR